MKRLFFLAFFVLSISAFSQNDVDVYPAHWWTGMKNKSLQLMLHAPHIGNVTTITTSYPGVAIKKVHPVENKNYLFVDLIIGATTRPGTITFKVNGIQPSSFTYELKPRRKGKGTLYAQGVNAADFIYLLMPDRFSNGDPSNDRIAGMKDQSLNRDSIFLRHGGDLQGVMDHLDYLQDLGVTTLWMTPVLENDMPDRTEHGYAITNHYKVDPRLGGNAAYHRLSDELHKRGMKLIQDAVYNHCGLQNFFIQDMPMKDWVHQWPTYTNPNYKDQTHFDPHASQVDYKKMVDGWFTPQMPDLNQSNPYVANFLIQHAIWSVEEFGVDGWRIDTYIYVDQNFMNRCNQALIEEYPKMTMFGEAWVHGTVNEAYFTRNNLNVPFKSNATGVTDFQTLFSGIQPALKKAPDGVNDLYQTLSNDLVYQNPMNNVIFLDNHDMTRFYSEVGESLPKLKIGIGWLLTERGTPQLYYGSEVLMKGISNPDGYVRLDFPGGWKGDAQNKFTAAGRSEAENDVFNWTRTIANYRKASSAIKSGKLMQYVPQNGVYTYFRYDAKQTVMVVMNTGAPEQAIDITRYAERLKGFTKIKNIITAEVSDMGAYNWKIPGETMWLFELVK